LFRVVESPRTPACLQQINTVIEQAETTSTEHDEEKSETNVEKKTPPAKRRISFSRDLPSFDLGIEEDGESDNPQRVFNTFPMQSVEWMFDYLGESHKDILLNYMHTAKTTDYDFKNNTWDSCIVETEDFKQLVTRKDIGDQIIWWYMNFLTYRKSKKLKKWSMINPLAWTEIRDQNTDGWLQKYFTRLSSKMEVIFVPINTGTSEKCRLDRQWCLLVVDLKNKRSSYYNSRYFDSREREFCWEIATDLAKRIVDILCMKEKRRECWIAVMKSASKVESYRHQTEYVILNIKICFSNIYKNSVVQVFCNLNLKL
jgi:hypothetical protein